MFIGWPLPISKCMRSIYDNAINRLEKAEKHSVLHTLKLNQTAILVPLKIGTFWTMKKSCFKRWISKSERTHWLIIRPKFLLWSHYTSGALPCFFCDLPQGPEEHKPIKGSFFAAYDIFERIHLSLGTWPCISHKCCNFMNGNTNNLSNILCLIILILTMNSKMLQLHVSRQQHWAFFRGDILQLVAPGV